MGGLMTLALGRECCGRVDLALLAIRTVCSSVLVRARILLVCSSHPISPKLDLLSLTKKHE
jgi:hypothetical protein